MKLVTIGSGNIGKSIGSWASKAGYEVIFTSRNPQHAKEAAASAGKNAKESGLREALATADLVLLAVPYSAVKEVLSGVKPLLSGKVIIDATNPLTEDFNSLSIGHTTSAAEEIAKIVPDAKVVKAFNTTFAQVYATQDPRIKKSPVTIFYAGDDKDAKSKVAELITRMGLDAVDSGPLAVSRNLEPLGMLNITLGYRLGLGTSIGFSLLR